MPCNAQSEPAEMSVILTVSDCLPQNLEEGALNLPRALKESQFDKGWM